MSGETNTGAGTANTEHLTDLTSEYVSLFDRLCVLAEELPVSHVIEESRVGRLLSAAIHYAEHGADLLDAADRAVEVARGELTLPPDKRTAHTDVPALLAAPYPRAQALAAGTDPRDAEIASLRKMVEQVNERLAAQEAAKQAEPAQPPPDAVVPTIQPSETEVTVEHPENLPEASPFSPPVDAPFAAEPASNAPLSAGEPPSNARTS